MSRTDAARTRRLLGAPGHRIALGCALALALGLGWPSLTQAQADDVEVHELDFYVHQNLIDVNGLAYYQQVIDDAVATAKVLLQGEQGPADSACCAEIASVSVQAFDGTDIGGVEDDLDILDFDGDLSDMESIAGGSPAVFLVTSIAMCGGSTTAVGCADTPSCGSSPRRISAMSNVAVLQELTGAVLAHERGHNACLAHVSGDSCNLMRAIAGGGCMSPTECTRIRQASQSTGAACACHATSSNAAPDATACTEGPISGVCSGGLCGELGSDASARLLLSAAPGSSQFGSGVASSLYDDWVIGSGVSGDWRDEANFSSPLRPTGLAFSESRGTLYGVAPEGLSDGVLVEMAAVDAEVRKSTTLGGYPGLIALAFDPGASPAESDDRLLAVDRHSSGAELHETLRAIDPDTGAVTTVCTLATNSDVPINGYFQGLAYDAANDQLFAAGPAGLFEIALTTPNCGSTEVNHPGEGSGASLARDAATLSWSAETGQLYMVGNQSGATTLYDVIDSTTLEIPATLGIDVMTAGGLAVPEASANAQSLAVLLGLALLAGWRRQSALAIRETHKTPNAN